MDKGVDYIDSDTVLRLIGDKDFHHKLAVIVKLNQIVDALFDIAEEVDSKVVSVIVDNNVDKALDVIQIITDGLDNIDLVGLANLISGNYDNETEN